MIFCGFQSVAVNSVYKLQFFTFIFAVLLLGLSRLLFMSLVLHFRFFKMAAVRHPRFLNVRNICCWSGVLFTIICVRTQKFLSHASSAIFRTCDLLSVCKNCLTYVQPGHDDRILFIERLLQWAIRRARKVPCLVCQFIFKMIKICEFDHLLLVVIISLGFTYLNMHYL